MSEINWNEIAFKKAEAFGDYISGRKLKVRKDNLVVVFMNDQEKGNIVKIYYLEKISDSENSIVVHDVLSGESFGTIINDNQEEEIFKRNIRKYEEKKYEEKSSQNIVNEDSISFVFGGLHDSYRGKLRSGSAKKYPEVCEVLGKVLDSKEDSVELGQLKELASVLMLTVGKLKREDVKFIIFDDNEKDSDKTITNRVVFVKSGKRRINGNEEKNLYTPLITEQDYKECLGDYDKLVKKIKQNMQNIIEVKKDPHILDEKKVPQVMLYFSENPERVEPVDGYELGFGKHVTGKTAPIAHFPNPKVSEEYGLKTANHLFFNNEKAYAGAKELLDEKADFVNIENLIAFQAAAARNDFLYNSKIDHNHASNPENDGM